MAVLNKNSIASLLLCFFFMVVAGDDSTQPTKAPPEFPPFFDVDLSCNFTVDIMFLQDFSDSSSTERQLLVPQLEGVLVALGNTFPNGRNGFATFVDKPIPPFGFGYQGPWYEGDWCLNVSSDLTFAGTPAEEVDILINGQPGGGNDFAENQLGALHDLSKSDVAKWGPSDVNEFGQLIRRVIIMSTDSAYHLAGDGLDYGLSVNDGSNTTDCDTEDYPTIAQVAEGLVNRGIYTVFLAGNSTGEDVYNLYVELLDALGTRGAVYNVSQNSSDLFEVVEKTIQDLEVDTCDYTVDIMFSQDVTWSYSNDRVNFRDGVDDVIAHIENNFTDNRYGLASFGDKPVLPFGHGPSGDFCVNIDQVLTNDTTAVPAAALALPGVSGIDWRESQLDSILSMVNDPSIGWRTGKKWEFMDLFRLVVLATDAGYHRTGDAADEGMSLTVHPGSYINATTCLEWQYPSTYQVGEALKDSDIIPVFIPTSDIASIYHKLVDYWATTFNITGVVVELKDFGDWTVPTTAAIVDVVARRRRALWALNSVKQS